MLLSSEIKSVAADLGAEAASRSYVKALVPHLDDEFWRLMVELIVMVLHRRGYVVAPRDAAASLKVAAPGSRGIA